MLRTALCQIPPGRRRDLTKIFLVMRLTIFLLIAGCLAANAKGHTQNITLAENNATLEAVFKKIKQQTPYTFVYRDEWMRNSKRVSISIKNATLQQVLNICFQEQPFTYSLVGNTVVLKQKEKEDEIKNFEAVTSIPAIDVSGIVTDETGTPLSGASVKVKGTSQGATADRNGHFLIKQVDENAVLLITYVGYEPQEVAVNNGRSIAIKLKQSAGVLNETVVIGYGTTTRRKSTGSISSITAEVIEKQPVANPLASLPGRLPGVLVAQNNGLPGSAVQIQIRGQNSLSQGAIPLYVIDGVPYTNFNGGSPANDNLNAFGISGANGGVSPFGLINPTDIERIDVLKDADATSIYGSRAANGVILITTKKGKAGKTKLDVNVYTGSTSVSHFIPVLNLQEYLQLRREAFANDNVAPTTATAPDLLVWDTTKSTNFQDIFMGGTGHVTDAQATLSGGTETTRFLFNSGYRRETTIFPTEDAARRISARLNVDHTSPDRKFNASFNMNYSSDKTNLNSSDLASVYNLPPNLPLTDPATGKLFFATGFTNPLTTLLKKYYGTTSNFIGNTTLRYTIITGLNLKMNLGYTASDLSNRTTNPASSNNPANNPVSSASFSYNKASNYIIEPTAEYSFKLGDGRMTALAGGSWQHNTSNSKLFNGTNYSNEALLGSLTAAGTVTVSYDNIVEYKYAAAFGRLSYDWKGKYILNANFRRDGSSRFGPNNRFGNFGSVGASWIFTEEGFIKNTLPFLSFGKLRGSYGTTGNDQISNYTYLPLYNSTTAYLGSAAIVPAQLANPGIQWETTKKMEFAIELGLFKDRVYLTTNYYRNRSSNQLTFLSYPYQSGYNSLQDNLPALIQNSGVEVELSSTNIRNKDFKWTTAFNITLPKNELVDFPGLANTFSATSYIIGMPLNFTRLYHYTGVEASTGKATYEDIDKNGSITTNDRYIGKIGTPYYGGLSNTLSYKGLQLDLFFQFNHRFGTNNIVSTRPGAFINQNTSVLDRWQPGHTSGVFFPGASATAGSPIANSYTQFSQSDALYGDASYIKFRSANLAYSLPAAWISRMKMSNCRLFVEGQNLIVWAKNKNIFDTETQVQGGPPGLGTGTIGQLTPPLRTVVFGINCSF
jgi:TonB-linked SusC/RagA family outer membrane protein